MNSLPNVPDEVLAHGQNKTYEQHTRMKFEVSCCCCLTPDFSNFVTAQTVQPPGQLWCIISYMHLQTTRTYFTHGWKQTNKNLQPRHCLCRAIYNELKVLKILMLKWQKWQMIQRNLT